MKNYFSLGLAAATIFWLLSTHACRKQPQTRQYEEETPVTASLSSQSHEPSLHPESWRWQKPLQWQEEKGGALRLVTFFITGREGSAECALIPLPGDGGGVKANVQRWLEQLQLPLFSQRKLDDFLGRQKKLLTGSGLPVIVVDFTTVSSAQNRRGPSLLVAIVQGENQTLFVKMSGGRTLLRENREVFFQFCQSLSLGA